jgi:hypothetical protein
MKIIHSWTNTSNCTGIHHIVPEYIYECIVYMYSQTWVKKVTIYKGQMLIKCTFSGSRPYMFCRSLFVHLSFSDCVVCPSSFYGFWLPFLLTRLILYTDLTMLGFTIDLNRRLNSIIQLHDTVYYYCQSINIWFKLKKTKQCHRN